MDRTAFVPDKGLGMADGISGAQIAGGDTADLVIDPEAQAMTF